MQKGDRVEKSAILAKIRDTDYQAKLNHANSTLEEAKASLGQAGLEFERYERLFKADALSKNEYDKYQRKAGRCAGPSNRRRVSSGTSKD